MFPPSYLPEIPWLSAEILVPTRAMLYLFFSNALAKQRVRKVEYQEPLPPQPQKPEIVAILLYSSWDPQHG